MTATTEASAAQAPALPDEVVTKALVRDVTLPKGAGTMALITLDNGFDHTKPNTFGPATIAGLTAALRIHAALPGPVRRLRACSALFDVSGISFHDGRLAIVAYNVFCIWPALLLGVPVLHLSQAMGPFRNRVNRAFGALVPRRLPPQLRARTPYRRARGHARPAGGALEHGGRRRLQLPARRQHHPRERRQGGRAPCRTHAHQG